MKYYKITFESKHGVTIKDVNYASILDSSDLVEDYWHELRELLHEFASKSYDGDKNDIEAYVSHINDFVWDIEEISQEEFNQANKFDIILQEG